jgi:hypothetical protein
MVERTCLKEDGEDERTVCEIWGIVGRRRCGAVVLCKPIYYIRSV